MRITVFGATGGTGRQVVQQALDGGHEVVAPVRHPDRLTIRHDRLEVLAGDVLDPATLPGPVDGADAVISTIGGRSKAERVAGLQGPGTSNIIAAMQAAGTRRLLVVSAAPLAEADPHDSIAYRLILKPLISRILRTAYADMGRMERAVRDSGLEWTIVRPPQLTNKPRTGHYRTELDRTVRRGYRISRGDLAELLLRSIDDATTVKAIVAVGY
ncbi:MAG TPA: SDR family oxidoreductase [Mycobacteriales bacterium]|jgi:putative NADH-flavin reductase|nr:SDR family oxidoreductase [Mycobacteriales bacterium]